MIRRSTFAVLMLAVALGVPATAQADFGFIPGSTKVTALDDQGRSLLQAGAHPDVFEIEFALNQDENGVGEGGEMRDVLINLPPGFAGNPQAVPECTRQQFEGPTPRCPGASQIGVLRATNPGLGETIDPIYDVEPAPGMAAQLGFSVFNFTVTQNASVRTDDGYGITVAAPNIPVEVTSVRAVVWGTPAAKNHDPERVCADEPGETTTGCSTDSPEEAFLTLPTACSPFEISVEGDSRSTPGNYVRTSALLSDSGGNPSPLVGCESVPFAPSVRTAPSASAADSPSGLGFELNLPNHGLVDPEVVAETEPVKTEVTFPAGIAVNPSAANGIGACTSQQYGQAACPEDSKIGTLFAKTPLLDEPIEGSIYLAAPHDNPFNSLLALYIIARAPNRGILIKQAGEAQANPTTGQLTSTFDHLPPIPYSSFEVRLREGPRAPLITPQTCGEYRTVARLYPYSTPTTMVERSVPFKITSGANGGACASSEAQLPAKPTLEAGATTPVAGAYSPFVFRLKRSDGEQRFSSVIAEPPPGLTAKLSGIPYCPQSGIDQAGSRTGEGDGALEQASPSCPAASQVGTVTASAGAGFSPYFTAGKVYLAGPYQGAPLSFEVIAPAIAGPFDLGVVSDRIALYVNEETAKITAKSSPLPSILHGIPIDIRSISVQLDRGQFSLNPTNCEATTVSGSLTTLVGALAHLSQRFAVGGCKGLDFDPQLKLQLKGATKRAGHPGLKAVITFVHSGEEAHTKSIQVGLPHSLFLDQGNLNKVCKQAELKSATCPKSSIYGHVKAWTPLLEKPLQGPVYLGVGYGYKLPALVTDLNGQIRILAHGRTDTTKQHGLRNTFEFVPDAPISRVVLQLKGGRKYSLIENSENLCAKPQTANARFVAHNGRVAQLHPKIAVKCRRTTTKRKTRN